MIPLLHDLDGETVLVFGGGPVGARKARTLAREARVVVVSPAFADRGFGEAELVRAAPAADATGPGDAVADWVERVSPALVVAATDDDAVNDAAAAAARDHGALVNRADRAGERDAGSVVMPATVREDPVVVAVATGGASPALSKYLREQVEAELGGAGEMAELTAEVRTDLRERGVDPALRRDAVRAVVRSSRVWKALRGGNANPRQVAGTVVRSVLDEGTGDTR